VETKKRAEETGRFADREFISRINSIAITRGVDDRRKSEIPAGERTQISAITSPIGE